MDQSSVRRVSHIWGNRRGQHIRSAMDKPRPGKTTFVIMATATTMQIEVGYKGTNARVEWIKYSVHTLNKSDCYAFAAGRVEAQVVPFPFRWTSDSNRMECVLALYQEETAWGNASCKTHALLFPFNRGKEQGPPPQKKDPAPSSNVNYTSCLLRRCINGRVSSEANHAALSLPHADIWWCHGGP
ncbi:hypothetical protein QTO34_000251 [Cnephaeus nilssonii]|uniref:Uncharacterized protein n=1 Tax=Cnephaeus nilssonii TaxID=3371016 RepID=A0AA40LUH3_CNENI|nr:hypothetical protein QTO34_000251 [Eptesicus nilssonii]